MAATGKGELPKAVKKSVSFLNILLTLDYSVLSCYPVILMAYYVQYIFM